MSESKKLPDVENMSWEELNELYTCVRAEFDHRMDIFEAKATSRSKRDKRYLRKVVRCLAKNYFPNRKLDITIPTNGALLIIRDVGRQELIGFTEQITAKRCLTTQVKTISGYGETYRVKIRAGAFTADSVLNEIMKIPTNVALLKAEGLI